MNMDFFFSSKSFKKKPQGYTCKIYHFVGRWKDILQQNSSFFKTGNTLG